jgi:hypothetical protein
MNTNARHSGSLISWVADEDFGEVSTPGAAPIVVYGEDLRMAGITKPVVGMRLDYRPAAHPQRFVTAAVDISVPRHPDGVRRG